MNKNFIRKYAIAFVLGLGLCIIANPLFSQQALWFGTVKMDGKILQGRFEVDSSTNSIIYAPYGITPVAFKEVKHQNRQLSFIWQQKEQNYSCVLIKDENSVYKGNCKSVNAPTIELVIRPFTPEDAGLQGENLPASLKDIQIVDRAFSLMNNGKNWSRSDNRVCDKSEYPYKWSLFCALHQASIDVDEEYRHLRHAMQATRQAINEATNGKQYAHTLRDFNNEAETFETIAKVLNRAKEIINMKIENRK